MRLRQVGLLAGAFLFASAAQANIPLTYEQVLCIGPVAAVGTIVGVTSEDCKLTTPDERFCDRLLKLTIRLDKLLKNESGMRAGQRVTAATRFENGFGYEANWTGYQHDGPNLVMPWTGKPVATADARRALLGKRYIFVLEVGGYPVPRHMTMPYSMSEIAQVTAVVTDPSCVSSGPAWDSIPDEP